MLKTILSALLLGLATFCQAQYQETFSTPNKGYLISQLNDFSGVDWTLSPWALQPPAAFGRDISDYFQTTAAGVLECIDLDQEVYWESPLLNTITVPSVSFSVDLTWADFDPDISGNPCLVTSLDYIKVQYSVDGGPYTTAPNIAGGSACATVGYLSGTAGGPFAGSATVMVNSIPGGSTLQIRISINTNSNSEIVTIDKVVVPESGVTQGCSAPELSTVVTPITCHGPNSGAINLSVLGGTPGYNFSWSSGAIAEDISGLALGTYTVTVTDAIGCTATTSATIIAVPFSFSADIGPATCAGVFDGAVDLVINGGTTPYTVDWGDLPGNNNPEDRTLLEAGAYIVTVSDAGGCTAEADVQIGLAPTGAYLETFDVPGKGLLPGSTCTDTNAISCSAQNFVAVNWSIYGLDTLFGIDPDDHFHTLNGTLQGRDLDQVVCWESPLIDIAPPGTGIVFSLDLSWEGFDAEPPGADPLDLVADHIDVEYSIDGGSWTRVANQVGGGLTGHTVVYASAAGSGQTDNMTVTVNDLAGNTLRIRVCGFLNSNAEIFTIDHVSVPSAAGLYCPIPALNPVATNPTCFGGSDGSIDLSLDGGTPPFTFEWSNGETTEDLSDLPAGPYVVTVTNGLGQTAIMVVQVDEPGEIVVVQDISISNPVSCNGGADGVLGIQWTNGEPPFEYLWSNAATTNPAENLGSGVYSVTLTDAKGCTGVLENLVLSDPPVVQGVLDPFAGVCPGALLELTVDTIFGGNGAPYQFQVDEGVFYDPDFAIPTGAGQHVVGYVDRLGCSATDTIVIEEFMPSNAMISGADSACVSAGWMYTLPGNLESIIWSVSDNGAITGGQGAETVEVLWNSTGAGQLSVQYVDSNGCQDSALFDVFVDICVGTKQPTLPGVAVAPNPFGNWLSVQFDRPVAAGTRLQLFDAQGRLVLEREVAAQRTRLDTGYLPEGMYFLHLLEGGRFGVWKVVK